MFDWIRFDLPFDSIGFDSDSIAIRSYSILFDLILTRFRFDSIPLDSICFDSESVRFDSDSSPIRSDSS